MKKRLLKLLTNAHVLYLSVRDSRTPISAKIVGIFALMWVVFPGDFDFIPVVGWIDDFTVVAIATGLVSRVAPSEVIEEKKAESPRRLRRFAYKVVTIMVVIFLLLVILIWQLI